MRPRILLSLNARREFYIDAVNRSGGIAVSKYCPTDMNECDGLILCGGNDISPRLYDEEITETVNIDYGRDDHELKLIEMFINANKPILGICRGCQIINAYFGGSLYQHIDTAFAHQSFGSNDITHKVRAKEGSILSELYGEEFTVNSAHHQAVKNLGRDLEVVATALDGNDTIEAIRHKTLPIFAVQFHPERMCFSARRGDTVDGATLFRKFIEVCMENKG